MILKHRRKVTLTIQKLDKNSKWRDGQGNSLVLATIPFRGSFREAETEIRNLERLACEAAVISGHKNNVHTNPPEGCVGKRLKYTWRFVGARSHVAEFVKSILCQ